MSLVKQMHKGQRITEEDIERQVKGYLIETPSGPVGNWEKLIKGIGKINDFGEVKDNLIRKVSGSELTAPNAPNSWIVSDGKRIYAIKNNDGEAYAFKHRDRALLYAELIGLTQNNVYGNSPRD